MKYNHFNTIPNAAANDITVFNIVLAYVRLWYAEKNISKFYAYLFVSILICPNMHVDMIPFDWLFDTNHPPYNLGVWKMFIYCMKEGYWRYDGVKTTVYTHRYQLWMLGILFYCTTADGNAELGFRWTDVYLIDDARGWKDRG